MDFAQHIELQSSCDKLDFESCSYIKKIMAQVVDMTDKVILDSIVDFAKREGITDLYLLDKEFVQTALERELKRRKCGEANVE